MTKEGHKKFHLPAFKPGPTTTPQFNAADLSKPVEYSEKKKMANIYT